MELIKKMAVITLMALIIVVPAFAHRLIINLKESPLLKEVVNWDINTKDDGMYFLLGPENPNVLILHVDETAPNGEISDYVTVYCNASHYRIAPNSSLTCFGNFSDVITMYVERKDFKNGAQGTYEHNLDPSTRHLSL